MTTMEEIAVQIIREQELIIGPIAWSEARQVQGITVTDQQAGAVTLDVNDSKAAIDRLVAQYERLFGRASREACREAVVGLLAELSPADIPSSLRAA